MAADLPSGYDPSYDFEMPVAGYEIMGLAALSAFALVGVGAFCTYAAAEAGTALDISYVIGGSTIVAGGTALTEGQIGLITMIDAIELSEALSEAGGIAWGGSPAAQLALESLLESSLLETFSVESLIALAAYQPSPLDGPAYGYFGGYLGNFAHGLPGNGGLTTPPGFPDFPGHGYPVFDPGAGAQGFSCVKVGDTDYCHWEY